MRQSLQKKMILVAAMAFSLVVASFAAAQMGKMKMMKPKMTTIKGTVIDLTCTSKGYAMTHKWMNAKEDHMKPDMKMYKGCATQCLKGGQPAGLFDGKTITAVFACNPTATLAAYTSKQVEVQGFWAGEDTVKTFSPAKIREGSGAWKNVDCATMH